MPYDYENTINAKQMEIFRTAKELRNLGELTIVFKSGENWFVRKNEYSADEVLSYLPTTLSVEEVKN